MQQEPRRPRPKRGRRVVRTEERRRQHRRQDGRLPDRGLRPPPEFPLSELHPAQRLDAEDVAAYLHLRLDAVTQRRRRGADAPLRWSCKDPARNASTAARRQTVSVANLIEFMSVRAAGRWRLPKKPPDAPNKPCVRGRRVSWLD